ncbi:hypothetical protein M3650_22535 [Paenibacillus sp. MER TA 81-3]|uniref:hypothetical protein n=1 Tax=Paenibacillus sp. MER TA 81-3 TaxID=2939573 RepID=UPI00203E901C|nr:hypothetical protein [Paenibacillus sp. MER TA 81-3]MCM3341335.1 hypothetical protein [Paenibacillus sp. MER TA 81-3]
MDKRTVIAAYQRGDITIHECAQIIGLEAPLQGWIPFMSSQEDRDGMPPQSHILPLLLNLSSVKMDFM